MLTFGNFQLKKETLTFTLVVVLYLALHRVVWPLTLLRNLGNKGGTMASKHVWLHGATQFYTVHHRNLFDLHERRNRKWFSTTFQFLVLATLKAFRWWLTNWRLSVRILAYPQEPFKHYQTLPTRPNETTGTFWGNFFIRVLRSKGNTQGT